MKKLVLGFAAALSLTIAAPAAHAQTARADWRERRQEQRIRVANMRGQLTPFEYRQLEAGQHRIDRLQRIAERDGRVSPWEARRIEQAQDVENARIQRFTHNGMNARGGGRRY